MLTQAEADNLIVLDKKISQRSVIFPRSGASTVLKLESVDGRQEFLVDVQRRGKIKLTKCTYQNRYRKDIILLRLDIDGPEHENPDGEVIPCPHLHIYREGFEDKWAFSPPKDVFNDVTDLPGTLFDFLRYCNVQNLDDFAIESGVF